MKETRQARLFGNLNSSHYDGPSPIAAYSRDLRGSLLAVILLLPIGSVIGFDQIQAEPSLKRMIALKRQEPQPKPFPPGVDRASADKGEIARNTPKAKRMNESSVSVVYSPSYLINLGGLENFHPFDIKKYQKIHEQLCVDGLLLQGQTLTPSPLTADDLKLVHSDNYLKSLGSRKNIAQYLEAPILEYTPMALDPAVLAPFRHASGGTLLAARESLRCGIGINIGGGYHHAKPDMGEGFCVYADIPIAIRKLQQEKRIKTALVIDVDVHQGNGTAVCLANDDTTYCFSMHERDLYPNPKAKSDLDIEIEAGLGDDEYLALLKKHMETVLAECGQPQICFVVAGCDTLHDDPLASTQMTAEGIVKRDAMIVEACVKRKIPVVLTTAGGYSEEAWKAQYESFKNLIQTYGLASQPTAPVPSEDKDRHVGR